MPLYRQCVHCSPLFRDAVTHDSAVCAITSRYSKAKKHIYPRAMQFAEDECKDMLMHGPKSIGLAQAFILLAMYSNMATRREDRSYIFAGLAMR
jgi:hypothetical protein